MSSHLVLYRRHISSCVRGYQQNEFIFDGDASRPDCDCPIVARGRLENESGRILHRTMETNSWAKARHRVALWMTWGQTNDPGKLALIRAGDVTVEQAVEMFKTHTFATSTQGCGFRAKANSVPG